MNIKTILIIFLLGIISFGYSQKKQVFTGALESYPKELDDYFENSKTIKPEEKKDIKEFFEYLELLWNSGEINESQKKSCVSVSIKMAARKIKPIPYFVDYIKTWEIISKSSLGEESFNSWIKALESLTEKSNNTPFIEFLNISKNLLLNNVLYESNYVIWKSDNNNFQFIYDSDFKVKFPQLNLKCYAKNDSSVIYNTKGEYIPIGKSPMWYGDGGIVNWNRADFNKDSVYAELSKYEIKISSASYESDSVTFINKFYFNEPLLGGFKEKILAVKDNDPDDKQYEDKEEEKSKKAIYPRFESYTKTLEINNLFDGINYIGGFAMHGQKFIGIGNSLNKAKVYFYKNDSLVMQAKSNSFVIRPDRITSSDASVHIYYKTDTILDSIYHPGLNFKYFDAKKEVSMIRLGEGYAKSPFYNSFHRVEMTTEAVVWNVLDTVMRFNNIGSSTKESSAVFESLNYYNEKRYDDLQGMDEQNPLVVLKKVGVSLDSSRYFILGDVSKYLHAAEYQLVPLMIRLAILGFIDYDFETKEIRVKDKTYEYIDSRMGRTDYDVIRFFSNVKSTDNAVLNLNNFDLDLKGVNLIVLSDSQNVFIKPHNAEMKLMNNRDFKFEGQVKAGRFLYFGKGFSFNYHQFRINMNKVDSLGIFVEKFPQDIKKGESPLKLCKSFIHTVTGYLSIDEPNNKSGLKASPEYPIFNSLQKSFVYYQQAAGGAYKKENFYFHLEPFVIDSLDNFTNEGLMFGGTFISGGIFPDIEDTLRLQPDYSLGFIRPTPPGGYPVYGGKGVFEADINLSNKGLKGNGVIKYLNSRSASKYFTFYPDSVNAVVDSCFMKEQALPVEYPQVKSYKSGFHWRPYLDKLEVYSSRGRPFDFFKGNSLFNGRIDLTPSKLTGIGDMNFLDATITSKLFNFKKMKFDSDTADFVLRTKPPTSDTAFSTTNYKTNIDFENRFGDFKSNGGASFVKFPFNQYICYMDQFKWLMDDQEIEMRSEKTGKTDENGVTYEGSEFISIHPDQDSLNFIAPYAKFSLKDYIIQAKDVRYIKVADAKIYPFEGVVSIQKGAYMERLTKAKILANDVTKYHNIFNAELNINGKYKYGGNGDYEYVDELNRKQVFHFDTVGVDSTRQTYAEGFILEDADFTLSPNFVYKGGVDLYASQEFLNFSGYTKLNYTCDFQEKTWLAFDTLINPRDIYIPIDSIPRDEFGKALMAGIVYNQDSNVIYPSILYKKPNSQGIEMISATGYLVFDKATREYRIASKTRLTQPMTPGNYFSLNSKKCFAYGEGEINTGMDFGQFKIKTYGNISQDMNLGTTKMDLVMALDFYFDETALSVMTKEMNDYPSSQAVNLQKNTFKKAIYEIFGQKEADKLISDISLTGSFKSIPKEIQHTMLLSDVKLDWNEETMSFRGNGRMGYVSLDKTQLNKSFKTRIELKKKRSGDEFNMLVELDGYNWFYFSYTRGIMTAVSSYDDFNAAVKSVDDKKREVKGEKEGDSYKYLSGTNKMKEKFIQKFDAF